MYFLFLVVSALGSVCGDGVYSSTEECEGVAHCTSECLCEDNYFSIAGVNRCIPECSIKGCAGECVSPNECLYCDGEGYQSSCASCTDNYTSNGYLECVPFEYSQMKFCADQAPQFTINIPDNYTQIIQHINPFDWVLSETACSPLTRLTSPFLTGQWFKLDMNYSGFISIETSAQYSQSDINYIRLNQVKTGTDTIIAVLRNCPSELGEVSDCAYENDDVDDYILASSLTIPTERTYYLFVHSPDPKNTQSFDLFIRRVIHPCSKSSEEISWNRVAKDGYSFRINTDNSVYSDSACVKL
ncbi:protein kinase domain containing protein, partial [Entamoeba invadens IP1]